MRAKKFIEKKIDGEYEFIKNHVIDIPIESVDLRECADELGCFDDPEMAITCYGVCIDLDDEIYSVDVVDFVNRIEGYHEDDPDSEVPENTKKLLEVLKQFKGYTLYPE